MLECRKPKFKSQFCHCGDLIKSFIISLECGPSILLKGIVFNFINYKTSKGSLLLSAE